MRPDIYRCNVNAFGKKLLYIFKFIPKDVSFCPYGQLSCVKEGSDKVKCQANSLRSPISSLTRSASHLVLKH